MNADEEIRKAVATAAGVEQKMVELEHPEIQEHGDYSSNVALKIFSNKDQRDSKYNNPRQLAAEIAGKINKDSLIERVEVAGPGFVNVFLARKWLVSEMGRVDENYGRGESLKNEKIAVEYTDPNPFKEFHIGHLISNVTGETLARLFEACGAQVWRADYFGDVGVHVAKSLWGLKHMMNEDGRDLESISKLDLTERVSYMGHGYALGSRKYQEDENAKKEMEHLNTVIYLAAQRMWKEEGKSLEINYDPDGRIDKSEINEIYNLYQTGRKWSLEYFEMIYKILGTRFDGYYPESLVGEYGYKLVKDNIGRVFEESEGAIIFPGEKYGLHTRVFINKHNLPTYEAKELGLAPTKYKDFAYSRSVIVVGKEIKEYFAVLKEALTRVSPNLGKVTEPICTGMVMLPEGKMGSRFGNVVTVFGLLEQLSQIVKVKYKTDDSVARCVSQGAVRYAFMKSSIGQDIVFDMEKSLSIQGNSGPYLQYTYARTRSVLVKSGQSVDRVDISVQHLNQEELEILRYIYRFPEIISEAAHRYTPNTVCNYLYELASRYNSFYNQHSILGAETPEKLEFRLGLTAAVGQILKNGLSVLGIDVLERM